MPISVGSQKRAGMDVEGSVPSLKRSRLENRGQENQPLSLVLCDLSKCTKE